MSSNDRLQPGCWHCTITPCNPAHMQHSLCHRDHGICSMPPIFTTPDLLRVCFTSGHAPPHTWHTKLSKQRSHSHTPHGPTSFYHPRMRFSWRHLRGADIEHRTALCGYRAQHIHYIATLLIQPRTHQGRNNVHAPTNQHEVFAAPAKHHPSSTSSTGVQRMLRRTS